MNGTAAEGTAGVTSGAFGCGWAQERCRPGTMRGRTGRRSLEDGGGLCGPGQESGERGALTKKRTWDR